MPSKVCLCGIAAVEGEIRRAQVEVNAVDRRVAGKCLLELLARLLVAAGSIECPSIRVEGIGHAGLEIEGLSGEVDGLLRITGIRLDGRPRQQIEQPGVSDA